MTILGTVQVCVDSLLAKNIYNTLIQVYKKSNLLVSRLLVKLSPGVYLGSNDTFVLLSNSTRMSNS